MGGMLITTTSMIIMFSLTMTMTMISMRSMLMTIMCKHKLSMVMLIKIKRMLTTILRTTRTLLIRVLIMSVLMIMMARQVIKHLGRLQICLATIMAMTIWMADVEQYTMLDIIQKQNVDVKKNATHKHKKMKLTIKHKHRHKSKHKKNQLPEKTKHRNIIKFMSTPNTKQQHERWLMLCIRRLRHMLLNMVLMKITSMIVLWRHNIKCTPTVR